MRSVAAHLPHADIGHDRVRGVEHLIALQLQDYRRHDQPQVTAGLKPACAKGHAGAVGRSASQTLGSSAGPDSRYKLGGIGQFEAGDLQGKLRAPGSVDEGF
ncbi:hypothetical protein HMPREF3173_18400 [Pseudomonas sp. HMSC08G10]|nr:hypothetical protein HMPREF3173_18400 [Pseudomonas sp. HMSC08G10]